MQDIMNWQAFTREDGTVDADKGTVLTVPHPHEDSVQTNNLTRQETAELLITVTLTRQAQDARRKVQAAQAFEGLVARV